MATDKQKAIQRLVKHLVESPEMATKFLRRPPDVAKELGIAVTASEGDLIREAIVALRRQGMGFKVEDLKGTTHYDFPECHHIEVPSRAFEAVVYPTQTSRAGKKK